jgi:Ca-activated chloride channel family protein
MNIEAIAASAAGLSALHFLRPQWLLALLALPLLAWWLRRRRLRQSAWRDAVDPHLLPHLLEGGPGARANGALWLGLLGAALAICALAGPSWQRAEQPLWQSRAPLVVALDLSSATLAADLPPSRLAQARAKLATLLRERAGGQVGLVAFADDAYIVAPLTDDAGNVALFLDSLAPDIMPVDGSRAGRAIERSAQLLRQAGFNRGDILLLTDHADAAARNAAASAARDGYRVSALGLGTAGGAAYRDVDGRIAQARLDAGSLRTLAKAGGGAYAALAAGDGDLAALGVLDPRQAGTIASHGEKTRLWQDQGYWLLLPVLLLALLAFRRGGALAAVLLCVLLPLPPARAAGVDWWQRADQQDHQRLEQGAQAYRSKDYAAAGKAWTGLPGADAAYNRGNALAKQGEYDAAIAAYDEALHLRPGMEDAIANRKAVEAAKKRKPPPGKQSGNQPDHQQGKGKSGQSGGQQPSQSGQSPDSGKQGPGSRDAGQPPASPPSGSPKKDESNAQPDKPAGTEAQRAADAAQRARMQQAMRDAGQGKRAQPAQAPGQAGKRDETPAQRERRLANEAWLRRVPDDPGGLLRARFRLEYERRQQGGQ